MTLGQKQRLFAYAVGRLIMEAYDRGYAFTLGDAHRDQRAFGPHGSNVATVAGSNDEPRLAPYGHPSSLHKLRLAIDFNLFKDGEWLDQSEDHRELGEWWEDVLGPEIGLPLAWGGRFSDGNHYSCEHQGMR